MTIVEIVLVTALSGHVGLGLAAISSCTICGHCSLPQVAQTEVQAVRAAAVAYRLDGRERCPTVDDLVDARDLDARSSSDPWNRPYRIRCAGDEVTVTSPGPDGELGTVDDVSSSHGRTLEHRYHLPDGPL